MEHEITGLSTGILSLKHGLLKRETHLIGTLGTRKNSWLMDVYSPKYGNFSWVTLDPSPIFGISPPRHTTGAPQRSLRLHEDVGHVLVFTN